MNCIPFVKLTPDDEVQWRRRRDCDWWCPVDFSSCAISFRLITIETFCFWFPGRFITFFFLSFSSSTSAWRERERERKFMLCLALIVIWKVVQGRCLDERQGQATEVLQWSFFSPPPTPFSTIPFVSHPPPWSPLVCPAPLRVRELIGSNFCLVGALSFYLNDCCCCCCCLSLVAPATRGRLWKFKFKSNFMQCSSLNIDFFFAAAWLTKIEWYHPISGSIWIVSFDWDLFHFSDSLCFWSLSLSRLLLLFLSAPALTSVPAPRRPNK